MASLRFGEGLDSLAIGLIGMTPSRSAHEKAVLTAVTAPWRVVGPHWGFLSSHTLTSYGRSSVALQKIVARVPADRDILFVPDQNLGQWVAKKTGRQMQLWPGSCYAHVLFTTRAIEKIRIQFPDAPVVAHPECVEAVRDLADEVCSTELMVKFAKESPADRIIVVTESGMLHRLRKEAPDKNLIPGPTDTCACADCRYMKMNTLEKLHACLDTLQPRIEMDEPTRQRAEAPILRMLEQSK
jgi:quinolinate synthase